MEELILVSHDDHRIAMISTNLRLVIIHKNNLREKISYDLSKYEINYIHQIILNDNILLLITDTKAFIVYL